MNYEYSSKAGYYGHGGWCVYYTDCHGYRMTVKVFDTEQQAIDYIGGGNE